MNGELRVTDLQQKLTTLRRAPPPSPTPSKEEKPEEAPFFKVKLKPTGKPPIAEPKKNESEENIENKNSGNDNNQVKTRASSIKERSKAFQNGSAVKPIVSNKPGVSNKKPVIGAKPAVSNKPPVNGCSNANSGVTRARPPSVLDKPSPKIVDSNKDAKLPELKPLPPLFALGDPPKKPPKFGLLKPSLKKYLGTSYPPRPVAIENNTTVKSGNDQVDTPPPAVLEAPPIPKKPTKPEIEKKPKEEEKKDDEDETEDFYDDTLTSNVPDDSEDFYDDTTANLPPPSEDFYDDTTVTNEFATSGGQEETFGEDIYEPIIGNQNEKQKEIAPPTLPSKDQGREDKKKKEKERKKKEKEEKEEKEREEKERKKRDKDREKKLNEMKRRFSVKGNEKSLGTCRASHDIAGNRMDIAATIGEEFEIIRKGKPNPNNKLLVKNKQGQYGFIDMSKIETEAEEPEDLYEEVPASKMRTQTSNGNQISSPPSTAPPPPPSQNAPRPPTVEQEIYDDVAGNDGEELYELLPEN